VLRFAFTVRVTESERVNTNILQQPETSPGQSALTVPRYGSKRDVAAMLQMSVRSVDNFVAKGCPCLRVSSRKLRFDMAEVRQWLSETYRTQRRAVKASAS